MLNNKYDLNIVSWADTYSILNNDECDNYLNGAAAGTYCGHEDKSKLICTTDVEHLYFGKKRFNKLVMLPQLTEDQTDFLIPNYIIMKYKTV